MPSAKQLVGMWEGVLRQYMDSVGANDLTPDHVAWLMENCGGDYYHATLAAQIVLNDPPPPAEEPA
jgi:hypothetical protein